LLRDEVQADRAASVESDPGEPPAQAEVRRFPRGRAEALSLRPVTADRPVIARPDPPITLFPGDSLRFYASQPLWLQLLGASGRVVLETPITRPSDTWFGDSTREGELGYALRTHARLDPASIPRRVGRAVTAVTLRNQDDEPMPVERIYLPAPQLAVYEHADGTLYTLSVTVTRHRDRPRAEVLVDARPEAGLLSPPLGPARRTDPAHFVARALSAILG
jgi:hypothetical protein